MTIDQLLAGMTPAMREMARPLLAMLPTEMHQQVADAVPLVRMAVEHDDFQLFEAAITPLGFGNFAVLAWMQARTIYAQESEQHGAFDPA